MNNTKSGGRSVLRYLVSGGFTLTLLLTLAASFFSFGKQGALVSVTAIMAGVLVLVEALPRVAEFAVGPVNAKLIKVEEGQQLLKGEIQAIRVALTKILPKRRSPTELMKDV